MESLLTYSTVIGECFIQRIRNNVSSLTRTTAGSPTTATCHKDTSVKVGFSFYGMFFYVIQLRIS